MRVETLLEFNLYKESLVNIVKIIKGNIEDARKNKNTQGVAVLINEGTYISRAENCMAPYALKDYSDSELKYVICCSADDVIVNKINEHFQFSRTLMDGPYCYFCCHDKRIGENFEHPSREF